MTEVSPVVNFVVFTGLDCIGPVVALILILLRAHGRIRVVGSIGSLLLIIGTVGSGLLALLLPMLQHATGLSTSAVALFLVPPGLISELGTIALGVAVVIRVIRRPTTVTPRPDAGGGAHG